jgi:DNA-binding transcriptional LysR family regulator
MALNLHLLRLFASVAAHRSFSHAATALHISQPAVSRGVRELEAQVGSRLLDRRPHGIALTEAGEMLMRHATALFAAERAAEEDLAALRGLARGSLDVGASTTIATWLLPPLLAAFHRAHPAITLGLHSANTQAVAERLLERALDVALVEGPVDHPGLVVQPWREDRLVPIAAPTHRLAGAAGLPAEALASETMIVREPGSGTRDVAWAALLERGVAPRETIEVSSTEMARQVVAAGLGVAIVSAATVQDQLALGSLVVLDFSDLAVSRTLNRLSLPGRRPSAAAAVFDRMLDGMGDRPG